MSRSAASTPCAIEKGRLAGQAGRPGDGSSPESAGSRRAGCSASTAAVSMRPQQPMEDPGEPSRDGTSEGSAPVIGGRIPGFVTAGATWRNLARAAAVGPQQRGSMRAGVTRSTAATRALTTAAGAACEVVVVGAGVMGLNVAYQLKRRAPDMRVTVLDRAAGLGVGSTGYSTGFMRAFYSRDDTMALALDGIRAYRSWADYLRATDGVDATFTETGAPHRRASRRQPSGLSASIAALPPLRRAVDARRGPSRQRGDGCAPRSLRRRIRRPGRGRGVAPFSRALHLAVPNVRR